MTTQRSPVGALRGQQPTVREALNFSTLEEDPASQTLSRQAQVWLVMKAGPPDLIKDILHCPPSEIDQRLHPVELSRLLQEGGSKSDNFNILDILFTIFQFERAFLQNIFMWNSQRSDVYFSASSLKLNLLNLDHHVRLVFIVSRIISTKNQPLASKTCPIQTGMGAGTPRGVVRPVRHH